MHLLVVKATAQQCLLVWTRLSLVTNNMNLDLTFSRVSSSGGADITMTRLSKRDERQGCIRFGWFPNWWQPLR